MTRIPSSARAVRSLALPLLAAWTACGYAAAQDPEPPADPTQPPAESPSGPAQSQDPETLPAVQGEKKLKLFLKAAGARQFDASLDGGGSFGVDRFYFEPGLRYDFSPKTRLSVSVGYANDRYDFSGTSGFAALRPWEDIDTVRASAYLRWIADEHWMLFGLPTVRAAAESGASLDDGVYGGVMAGAAYRFDENLTIGPGLGVFSQIEDDATVFPILLIDWRLSETLRVETGRGMAASQGPGLTLAWEFVESWEFLFGGRYERQRFRLDSQGVAPDGVGEEESFPIFGALTKSFGRDSRVGIFGGVNLSGRLSLDDSAGNGLTAADYDPAAFFGFVLEL